MTGQVEPPHWRVQIMGQPPQVHLTVWEDGRPATTPLDERDVGMLLGALDGAARTMERRTEEQEQP